MATHKDMQGRTLRVGDTVAYVSYHTANSLVIGRITNLKKVRAEVVTNSQGWLGGEITETVRSDQLVKVAPVKSAVKPQSAKILAFPNKAIA
jgi:hypothetical protein